VLRVDRVRRVLPPDDPSAAHAARSDVPIVAGVPLWEEWDPRARSEDIARVAAARDPFVVLGLGDSIMYGIAPHEGGDVPGERMRVALRIGLPATSWTSGRCSRTDARRSCAPVASINDFCSSIHGSIRC
jgi:hypothetical protein